MKDGLPQGWASVELENHVYIAGRIGWRGLKRSEYTTTGPLFLAVKNILPNGEIDFTDTDHITRERYDESPEIILQPGDILLTKDGSIGKVGMVASIPTEVTVNSSILVVRPKDSLLEKRYLFQFFRGPQFQQIAHERITGSAIPHLFQKDIKKLRALVPPIKEQQRIVAKLEALLGKVDACQKRLEHIPTLLKRFRQAVLAAACSGRLTADGRDQNPDVEIASDLLIRIKTTRLASAQNTKEKNQIAEAFQIDQLAVETDELGFSDIPSSWLACRIGAIGTVVNGSTPSRKRPEYWNGEIPWVSSGEVRNNYITVTREKITSTGYENCS